MLIFCLCFLSLLLTTMLWSHALKKAAEIILGTCSSDNSPGSQSSGILILANFTCVCMFLWIHVVLRLVSQLHQRSAADHPFTVQGEARSTRKQSFFSEAPTPICCADCMIPCSWAWREQPGLSTHGHRMGRQLQAPPDQSFALRAIT